MTRIERIDDLLTPLASGNDIAWCNPARDARGLNRLAHGLGGIAILGGVAEEDIRKCFVQIASSSDPLPVLEM